MKLERRRERERERERATEKLGAKEVEGMVTFSYTFYGITYSPYVALAQQVLYYKMTGKDTVSLEKIQCR